METLETKNRSQTQQIVAKDERKQHMRDAHEKNNL
jgi:hypothetical protein